MQRAASLLPRLGSGDEGQSLVEYGLIIVFIVVTGLLGVTVFGTTFGQFFSSTLNRVSIAV